MQSKDASNENEETCRFVMFMPPCPEGYFAPQAFSFKCDHCGHVEWYGMPANMERCPECRRKVVER